MVAYLILQKGFEYNDEINLSSGGGHPQKIFFSLDTDLTEICDDQEKLLNFCDSLNQKYGKIEYKDRWSQPDEFRLNPLANEEESKAYASMIDLNFYEVVSVEVDQQDMRDSKLNQLL
jgi:hypothetical protein